MISVKEALKIIGSTQKDFGVESVQLDQSLGRTLREDLYADRDLPPYHRVTMDGIAIQYKIFLEGQRNFKIEGLAPAGTAIQSMMNKDACFEVMTGSVLPMGTDTVVRYEDVKIHENHAMITVDQIKEKQNVHFKGLDRKEGECILKKGTRIGSAEIGIAASVGKSQLQVGSHPSIIILSTGDELVEVSEQPLDHQIRKSNLYSIQAALSGVRVKSDLGHLADDKLEIEEQLKAYLEQYDVLILSGGVSKGKFDFLPEVLASLGVEKKFHKVAQRPGKPFWFGQKNEKVVFAFPGNPVSTYMCSHFYLLPWIAACQGGNARALENVRLGADLDFKPSLQLFLEVSLRPNLNGITMAIPQRGNGSGDLFNLSLVDGFLMLPPDRSSFKKGEIYPLFRLR